jgi:hypothetical protein
VTYVTSAIARNGQAPRWRKGGPIVHVDQSVLDDPDIRRATNALIETYGTGINALQVAARRANNAELSGATEAAYRWKRIAAAIMHATQG